MEIKETARKAADEVGETVITESVNRMEIEHTKNVLLTLIDVDKEVKKEKMDKIHEERTKRIERSEEMLDDALETGDLRAIEAMLNNLMK